MPYAYSLAAQPANGPLTVAAEAFANTKVTTDGIGVASGLVRLATFFQECIPFLSQNGMANITNTGKLLGVGRGIVSVPNALADLNRLVSALKARKILDVFSAYTSCVSSTFAAAAIFVTNAAQQARLSTASSVYRTFSHCGALKTTLAKRKEAKGLTQTESDACGREYYAEQGKILEYKIAKYVFGLFAALGTIAALASATLPPVATGAILVASLFSSIFSLTAELKTEGAMYQRTEVRA